MEILGDMMGPCVKVQIFFISDRQKYFIMDLNVAPQQDLWLQAPLARLRLLATLNAYTMLILGHAEQLMFS